MLSYCQHLPGYDCRLKFLLKLIAYESLRDENCASGYEKKPSCKEHIKIEFLS